MAFELAALVQEYVNRVRRFYYEVMLWDRACPKCAGRVLRAVGEGRCQCSECGHEFDPVIAFQTCTECGGSVRLRVSRYRCSVCGSDVRSLFHFDARVFDATYFRQKMAEHRVRKKQYRTCVANAEPVPRSMPVGGLPIDLDSSPGLANALDDLVGCDIQQATFLAGCFPRFDLSRYQSHIQAQLDQFEVSFDEIPVLEQNARLDRIWRFIAIIFMAHARLIDIQQDGHMITLVNLHEAH
ncbi:MAG: hypothetical protein D8M59_07565 [Planctomycetes bacterium]|nr:hypothetical protein [Planctomycetota bacterium]